MAHAFDIRFGKHIGLAALFEAPANRLRWKGAGRLSIEGDSVSIAVKRSLLTLFTRRSRRIAAHELTEVYREGDSLRLEFGGPDAREVLPIWTAGNDTAAEIVKLLPTSRTVELEHSTASGTTYRFDRPLLVWVVGCAGAVLISLGVWRSWSGKTIPPAAVATEQTVPVHPELPATSVQPSSTPASPADLPARYVYPVAVGSIAYPAARRTVDDFKAELADRLDEQLEWLDSPSPVELEAMQHRWDEMIERIHRGMYYQGPELWLLRDVQLSICRDWKRSESMWAEGLRAHDTGWIEMAFDRRRVAASKVKWLDRYVPGATESSGAAAAPLPVPFDSAP